MTEPEVEVFLSRHYVCHGYTKVPEIQLNQGQAQALFGGPLREFERVVVIDLS